MNDLLKVLRFYCAMLCAVRLARTLKMHENWPVRAHLLSFYRYSHDKWQQSWFYEWGGTSMGDLWARVRILLGGAGSRRGKVVFPYVTV